MLKLNRLQRLLWGPLAQRLVRQTHNLKDGGSNPSGPTITILIILHLSNSIG